MSTVPTFEQLVEQLAPGDPELLRKLCPPSAMPTDRTWMPPAVPKRDVSRSDMFGIIAGAVAAGVSAPVQVSFTDAQHQLEIEMSVDDRAGVVLMATLFGLTLPTQSNVTVLLKGKRAAFFGSSHARVTFDPDDADAEVLTNFGGWAVSVVSYVTLDQAEPVNA